MQNAKQKLTCARTCSQITMTIFSIEINRQNENNNILSGNFEASNNLRGIMKKLVAL